MDDPGRVGTQLEIVALDSRFVLLEAPRLVPMQALLVLGPHMRRDGADFQRRVRHDGGNDLVQRGGDEAHGAVGRQQAERLDV